MTIEEAIAEVRRVTPGADPWTGADMNGFYDPTPVDFALAVIANAAISGDLIPLGDHRLAVALVVQKALEICASQNRRGRDEYDAGWDRCADTIADGISAHIDADPLAEVQALRAQIGSLGRQVRDLTTRADGAERDRDQRRDCAIECETRAEAAEAEVTRLREALEDIADGMGETELVEIGRFAPVVARAALQSKAAP